MSGIDAISRNLSQSQLARLQSARAQFPALAKQVAGLPAIFFDGPGGTQVPQSVIDAIASYYSNSNANSGGSFQTSEETDDITETARGAMADLLGCHSDEVVFGANMTTLTFAFSRAIGRELKAGDEIITTALDHDANVAPWKALKELGVVVHKIDFDPRDCTLKMDQFDSLFSKKTKLVAVGYASNAVGTVNDVKRIIQQAKLYGALTYIDAVHYAPHGPIDVQDLDCDFLACSPYKFFAPHMGVVFGKREHLSFYHPYKVRPSSNKYPDRWETGTQNFEAQAGLVAAINYVESLSGEGLETPRRTKLLSAMTMVRSYERSLSEYFVGRLAEIQGLTLYGLADPALFDKRTPTFGFNLSGVDPLQVCKYLANQNIYAWDGNFYAIGVTERLNLESTGGMVRVGFVHYNTVEEIDRLIQYLHVLSKQYK